MMKRERGRLVENQIVICIESLTYFHSMKKPDPLDTLQICAVSATNLRRAEEMKRI